MNRRPLVLSFLLIVLAVAIIRALATQRGVGAGEYATAVVLVGLLLFGAFRLSRRALRRA